MVEARKEASLDDFRNFHGMLCHPSTANRCIQEFAGSTVLFLPSNYTRIAQHDCSGRKLNLLSYYALVAMSCTGFLTLVRHTRFLVARVVDIPLSVPFAAECDAERLVVRQDIMDYVMEKNPGSVDFHLRRWFEYDFGILSVVMLHIACNQRKMHLVEVYHIQNRFLRSMFGSMFGVFGELLRFVHEKERSM